MVEPLECLQIYCSYSQVLNLHPTFPTKWIIEKNKETYYSALNESQSTFKKEREDVSAWMLFFLEVIRAQVSGAAALIEKKEDMEIILSQKQL